MRRHPETDSLPEKRCADKDIAAFLRRAEIRFILPSLPPFRLPPFPFSNTGDFSDRDGFLSGRGSDTNPPMSLRCFLGRHRPMLTSIVSQDGGYRALCDDCSLPMTRYEDSRWVAAEPLVSRRDQAA